MPYVLIQIRSSSHEITNKILSSGSTYPLAESAKWKSPYFPTPSQVFVVFLSFFFYISSFVVTRFFHFYFVWRSRYEAWWRGRHHLRSFRNLSYWHMAQTYGHIWRGGLQHEDPGLHQMVPHKAIQGSSGGGGYSHPVFGSASIPFASLPILWASLWVG